MDEQRQKSQQNSSNASQKQESIKQVSKIQALNIDQLTFQPPTKNPEEVFISKSQLQNKQNANQIVDDNKSQTSHKSGSSVQKKRKGSFIQRMSQLQQSEQQKLNEKRKADLKAVFLENVDYKATKQELQLIFEDCAKIQRITILKNPFTNHPKGCAYISFETEEGVQRALHLNGVTLRNRVIKVHRKRTNLPGKNKMNKQEMGMNFLGMMQNFNRPNPRGRGRGRGR